MLAPDPVLPRRDALLRPETMAGVLSQRLHAGVPVDACERMYVKYRVGDSVRVVYRYRVGETTAFAAARSGRRDGVPAPEVDAALYPFPHDRKLAALPRLPGRLIAWAAEQSATAQLDGAYAKVQRADGERRGLRALADQDAVRVPRLLADEDGVLTIEALPGRPPDLHGLGRSLRALHNLKRDSPSLGNATAQSQNGVDPGARDIKRDSPSLGNFVRLDRARLVTAAEVIAAARPEAGDAAKRFVERLGAPPEQPEVLVHGDANLGNAVLLEDGTVALLDLEHLAVGPAAADVGQVVANLLVAGADARPFLEGYGTLDREALSWYTRASLLARVALPAISRYRPQLIARLPRLLA
ncbi:aminoglycoside phosphotransferase family protein [Solirubrobacter sp. CPCC 204708]|uniref:Aminoglycoside phosphotransferase family protein n=1 Tax=Solirubrobacter deserti TaxID=2282478 RepID=A0ABT4RPI4_9ACTN|nr:aminoglycoside phosphotransferase family protein [Solirubrobacter deserti]MBE2319923.1 aminoglycoside phosphotransferase family protein [Solirubrobacter deserti]MDA0140483.1 aminoglycoside phosphotransferase family protein [Solirubrobacter deserti]